jgi:hypothetical protein
LAAAVQLGDFSEYADQSLSHWVELRSGLEIKLGAELLKFPKMNFGTELQRSRSSRLWNLKALHELPLEVLPIRKPPLDSIGARNASELALVTGRQHKCRVIALLSI